MNISKLKPILPLCFIALAGCAYNGAQHRPQVSNSDLVHYERDLAECQNQAANDKDLQQTKKAGLAGAAAGAIVGAIEDDAVTGAIIGAIVGTTSGEVLTRKKQQEYVIQCMQKLGYNVVADD